MLKNILLLSLILFEPVFAAVNYEQLKNDRTYCYKIQTSECFLKLINKYSLATDEWRNILYSDYATMLLAEKNYSKAQAAFKTVLFREKNNKQLIEYSQKKLDQINQLYRNIRTANNMDAGSYFDKTKEKLLWEYPYNIKVYIASKTGKEDIFKKAFGTWDSALFKTVNFSYVQSEDDADITIKYVDKLDGNVAGITKYPKVVTIMDRKYLKKVVIEVALQNPSGGRYTDTNLLSVALHEIGHGLGINYHSENLNDIMYYSTETYKNTNISKRDINTVVQLYR